MILKNCISRDLLHWHYSFLQKWKKTNKPTKNEIYIKAQLNFWRTDYTLWKGILGRNWDTYPETLGWEHCKGCITTSTHNPSGHIGKIVLPILVKTISAKQAAIYFFPHRRTKKIIQNLSFHVLLKGSSSCEWALSCQEGRVDGST